MLTVVFRALCVLAAVTLALLSFGCAGVPMTSPPSPPLAPAAPEQPAPEKPAPAHPDEAAATAAAAYYRGDREASLEAYRALLEKEPENTPARLDLARLLREAGRPLEALDHLEALLARKPEEERIRLEAAETALLAHRSERALELLEPAAPSGDTLFLSALARELRGNETEAAAALADSLDRQSFNPLAWFRSAALHFRLDELELAEEHFRKALAQEPNLILAYYPLALIYLARGELPRGYNLLRRADAAVTGDPRIGERLRSLLLENPSLGEETSAVQQRHRQDAAAWKAETTPENRESIPLVRVGLAQRVQEVYLKTGGRFVLASSEATASGEDGRVLRARRVEDGVELADAEGGVLLRSASPIVLAYDDPLATTLVFDVEFGQGSFWAGSEDRMYRGKIELVPHPDGLTLIDALPVEEYLYSVLPSEMPAHWPAAALQAQAIAARSYTLANLGRFSSRGFDLQGDVRSAAYRGATGESPATTRAIDATRGVVLMDGEQPLSAFYSANCGGRSETTEVAWGFPSGLPAAADPLQDRAVLSPEQLARWLADRPAAYCSHPAFSSRSAYRWRLWVPRELIEARLGLGEKLGAVRALVTGSRGSSGRVSEVLVLGTAGEHTLRWDAIRWNLGGLRSNLFIVEPYLGEDGLPLYFLFTGAGWGHGVGLCQSGAAGMADAGYGSEEILRQYYGDAPLVRLY